MNKTQSFLTLVAVFVIGVALGFYVHTPAVTPVAPPQQQVVGAASGNEHYNPEVFYNSAVFYSVTDRAANSPTTPTTTLASYGITGHITVGAGQTSESASTTAITSKSDRVVFQEEQTTPIAGVTCNTTLNASSTEASSVYASSTNPTAVNGFVLNVASAPVTNPFCFSYGIVHQQ